MSSPSAALRRLAAPVALATTVAGAAFVAGSPPASAAPMAGVFVCFRHLDGAPYTGPTYAQGLGYRGWLITPAVSSPNGCTRWSLETGHSWRFVAYGSAFRRVVEGESNWTPLYYPGRYNSGTWIVYDSWF